MGACFGIFKKRPKTNRLLSLRRCVYRHDQDKVELDLLVEDGAYDTMSKSLRLDRGCPRSTKLRVGESSDNVSESQQLLSLDAYSLLASRAVKKRTASCCSSTPPSSLDLEWENESVLQATNFRSKSVPSSNIDDGGSSCSGGGAGSPESLEWDPCDSQVMDYDAEQLINEIEILTRRALQETGDWTKTGS